jgi:hypothetical protein
MRAGPHYRSLLFPLLSRWGARGKKRGTVMNERGEVSRTSAKSLKGAAKCLV